MTSAGEAISLGVKRLQIRGHRGIVQRKHLLQCLYRCVAVNCRNVVDLSKCIFVHNLFLWRLNNHFMKVQQAKWEPIQATVFQEYALMETVN